MHMHHLSNYQRRDKRCGVMWGVVVESGEQQHIR